MRFFIVVAILFAVLPGPGLVRAGSLSGSALWRYAEYEGDRPSQPSYQASHMVQQYSLLYEQQALLNSGRAGWYRYNLGYEWTSVASRLGEESERLETGKILFRGELTVAPGGLPFRLNVYSHDDHRTGIVSDFRNETGRFISPHIANNVTNGQHVVTGASLLFGIRNGSYLGAYRDMLSRFPKLLMDFKQIDVRDLNSLTPIHYRLRNLAFVSLNKKDNWFHYRFTDFRDYLNPREDFNQKSYTLGTIDHLLVRKWINLTNWIKLSADGSITQYEYKRDNEASESYTVNLFSTLHRQGFGAANFTRFDRSVSGTSRNKVLELPFYFNKTFSRDTSCRLNAIVKEQLLNDFRTNSEEERHDRNLEFELTAWQTRSYVITTDFSLENNTSLSGKTTASQIGLRYRTNPLRLAVRSYDFSYRLSLFRGEGRDAEPVDYLEHSLQVSAGNNSAGRWRWSAAETMSLGQGTLGATVTTQLKPNSGASSSGEFSTREGSVFKSDTRGSVDYSNGNFQDQFSSEYNLVADNSGTDQEFSFTHKAIYNRRVVLIKFGNWISYGWNDRQSQNSPSDPATMQSADNQGQLAQGHDVTWSYRPNRLWNSDIKLAFTDNDGKKTWEGEQTLNRNFFTVGGVTRNCGLLSESMKWQRIEEAIGTRRETTLHFAGQYFPIRRLTLGFNTYHYFFAFDSRENYSPANNYSTYGFNVGGNFPKLQVTLDYILAGTGVVDGFTRPSEQRWEVTMKKIF